VQDSLLQYFITQGVFAVLFVCLLWWVLRENSKREAKLTDVNLKMTEHFNNIELILEKIVLWMDRVDQRLDKLDK
jgi:hypothetical protein